ASKPLDARTVDVQGTKNLLECVDRRKIRHFVYVSIAGVDRSRYPYYTIKYEVEKLVQASGVPWSVLRATQFHDLVLNRFIKPFDGGDGAPIRIPKGMRFQSIDVREVALRLQQLAMSAPLTSTETIGGPEILTIEEMTRIYLQAKGSDAGFLPDDVTGELYDVFRSGINIDPQWTYGKITWENFLRNRVNAPLG
ncbi:MAG TPA: NAD(P)H-binding protein, partial [Chryseosolibacter sp.]